MNQNGRPTLYVQVTWLHLILALLTLCKLFKCYFHVSDAKLASWAIGVKESTAQPSWS